MAAMHIGGTTFENVARATNEPLKQISQRCKQPQATLSQPIHQVCCQYQFSGPVFQDLNFIRPVVNAVGARAMPSNQAKHLCAQQSPRTPASQHNHQNLLQRQQQQWLSHQHSQQNNCWLDKSHCQFKTLISPIQQRSTLF
jgi:hypothetical protein